jgi:hypothetical protein
MLKKNLFFAIICFCLFAALPSHAAQPDFTGVWHRTNIDKTHQGTIEIQNQTSKSFSFEAEVWSGANDGALDGTAVFTKNHTAVYKHADEYSGETAEVVFRISNDLLIVECDNEMPLGFGMGAFISGEYTKSDPVYSNADIVNEILPTEAIKDLVRKVLGESAYKGMVSVMEEGTDYDSDGLTYSGFIRGAGMGFELLVDGNKVYCFGYNLDENDPDWGSYTFYTNDRKYADKLPPFMPQNFEMGNDATLKFAYKDTE